MVSSDVSSQSDQPVRGFLSERIVLRRLHCATRDTADPIARINRLVNYFLPLSHGFFGVISL